MTACQHENLRHIEEHPDAYSYVRHASWCEDCGALNDGTWRLPKSVIVISVPAEDDPSLRALDDT
jgi:hypothetical protein